MEHIKFDIPDTAEDMLKGIDTSNGARYVFRSLLEVIFTAACIGVHTDKGKIGTVTWNEQQAWFFLEAVRKLILSHPSWTSVIRNFVDEGVHKNPLEAVKAAANILAEEMADVCNDRMSHHFRIQAKVDKTEEDGKDVYNVYMMIDLLPNIRK